MLIMDARRVHLERLIVARHLHTLCRLLPKNYSDKNNRSLARWLTKTAVVLLQRLTVTQQSINFS